MSPEMSPAVWRAGEELQGLARVWAEGRRAMGLIRWPSTACVSPLEQRTTGGTNETANSSVSCKPCRHPRFVVWLGFLSPNARFHSAATPPRPRIIAPDPRSAPVCSGAKLASAPWAAQPPAAFAAVQQPSRAQHCSRSASRRQGRACPIVCALPPLPHALRASPMALRPVQRAVRRLAARAEQQQGGSGSGATEAEEEPLMAEQLVRAAPGTVGLPSLAPCMPAGCADPLHAPSIHPRPSPLPLQLRRGGRKAGGSSKAGGAAKPAAGPTVIAPVRDQVYGGGPMTPVQKAESSVVALLATLFFVILAEGIFVAASVRVWGGAVGERGRPCVRGGGGAPDDAMRQQHGGLGSACLACMQGASPCVTAPCPPRLPCRASCLTLGTSLLRMWCCLPSPPPWASSSSSPRSTACGRRAAQRGGSGALLGRAPPRRWLAGGRVRSQHPSTHAAPVRLPGCCRPGRGPRSRRSDSCSLQASEMA